MSATAEETTPPEQTEPTFSLALTQDQKDIRDWAHGFAAGVMRPAAHEWDEREETPWPIIGEAAKIGLYGFEALAQFYADPSGLTLPIVNEELFWGDAGIGMSIMGTSLAVAAIFGQGSGEQIGGSYYLLDLTALGRQEDWEEPKGRAHALRSATPGFED